MSICLSNLTADLALRELRRKGTHLDVVSSQAVSAFEADVEDAREAVVELGIPSSERIELLVGTQEDRRSTGQAFTHMWTGTPPEGSLYIYQEGLYLPTPCFCLLQQARELHVIQLCQMLGYYLGTEQMTVVEGGVAKQITLPPLVTEEQLWEYLLGARGTRGVRSLRMALQYTCAGAASPQETNLQLILTLPASLYGFALKPPVMNYEIPLGSEARRLYNHETCRIDLYWPEAQKGLEYQGEEHGKQLGQDYARNYALLTEGREVLYLAKEQLSDVAQMQFVARWVAKALGERIGGPFWPTEQDTQTLIDIISGRVRPQKGLHKVLRRRSTKP